MKYLICHGYGYGSHGYTAFERLEIEGKVKTVAISGSMDARTVYLEVYKRLTEEAYASPSSVEKQEVEDEIGRVFCGLRAADYSYFRQEVGHGYEWRDLTCRMSDTGNADGWCRVKLAIGGVAGSPGEYAQVMLSRSGSHKGHEVEYGMKPRGMLYFYDDTHKLIMTGAMDRTDNTLWLYPCGG